MEKSELLETFSPKTLFFAFYSKKAAKNHGYAVYKHKESGKLVDLTILTKNKDASNYYWDDKFFIGEINLDDWSFYKHVNGEGALYVKGTML